MTLCVRYYYRPPAPPDVTEKAKLNALLKAIADRRDPDEVEEGFETPRERYEMLRLAMDQGLIACDFDESGAALAASLKSKGRAVLQGEMPSPFDSGTAERLSDADASIIVLRWFYDNRTRFGKSFGVIVDRGDFDDRFSCDDLVRYVQRLHERGLVVAAWNNMGENCYISAKSITPDGIDKIEMTEISQNASVNQVINFHAPSTGVQIGNNNKQRVEAQFKSLVQAIEEAKIPQEDKARLLGKVSDLARDPALGNFLQGASLIAQLFGG